MPQRAPGIVSMAGIEVPVSREQTGEHNGSPDSMITSRMKLYKIGAESPIWSGFSLITHTGQVCLSYQWPTTDPRAILLQVYSASGWNDCPWSTVDPVCPSAWTQSDPLSSPTLQPPKVGGTQWEIVPQKQPMSSLDLINVVIPCSPRSLSNHVGRGADRPCANSTAPLAQPGLSWPR